MREQDLARIEAGRVVALLLWPRAEEGDLEAERSFQPAGDVPPLGAEVGMRAVVAREDERPRPHLRILNFRSARHDRHECAGEKGAAPHQSSRTARTGPMPIA